jgi:hypothetical protein
MNRKKTSRAKKDSTLEAQYRKYFVFCDQTKQAKQSVDKDSENMKTWVTYGTMGIVQP